MAALNFGVAAALVGLSVEQAHEMRLTFGKIMGEVVVQIINPAVHAFPELETDELTWVAIAKERAASRS